MIPGSAPFRLDGLRTGPPQSWGAVRIVPLLRDAPVEGLRLHRSVYDGGVRAVDVGDGSRYVAYIPHAFVATYGDDDAGTASYGTRMGAAGRAAEPERMAFGALRRMARRRGRDRLRFLPLHLAVEGYLALHFGGPEIVWERLSRRVVAGGLSPRAEQAVLGLQVAGLEDALRIFEIHPGQCGVCVYAADSLASVFIVPHPDDYRALHATLLEDMFGELIYHYALLMPSTGDLSGRIDAAAVRSLADLRAETRRLRAEWADFHDEVMAGGVLTYGGEYRTVQYLEEFTLGRHLPEFVPGRENHISESISHDDGRIAYFKSFRLSEAQVRRGHLLRTLARNDWHVQAAAADLGQTEAAFGLRLDRAGFGDLLRPDVLDLYRAEARRGRA
ncbi:ARPP-2 domain-containing protein [Actinomadura parmotrematis]|uniref:ARG and Rhodanese-Phosphatase-superfamily-associated domain-containing protein n=1 Tax=Actinomadura parmotrematis TaxID=2864039 RepID=A0ABS7G1M9_9ACTN|nr:hypothetical protein [Actinomadura parmotrematis]MBW8486120.1 hypothetical protein [Actinomadura parmotrematis]